MFGQKNPRQAMDLRRMKKKNDNEQMSYVNCPPYGKKRSDVLATMSIHMSHS